jgi:TPR repeat protein
MHRILRLVYVWAVVAIASPAAAFDSREYIERAVALIEAGRHELARTYLDPALIDFRLLPWERSRAYYLRGYSYYAQRLYVSANKDYNRALEFHPGNAAALAAVGQMHIEGLGVDPNPPLGAALLQQAAEGGHPPAKLRLGIAYLRGVGTPQDLEVGREWLTAAAEAGVPAAFLYLAQSYRQPLTSTPDPALARSWFLKAHEAGEPDALAHLGFMAESGEGGDADPAAARQYFQQAAEAGSAVALAKLGHAYLTGDGVEVDAQKALTLFQSAAHQGHPTGYMGLAYFYDSGTLVERDEAQAAVWYQRAAEAGLPDAQIRMAYLGLRRGDQAGQHQARAWFAKAAAQNSVQALNDYAWLLATSQFESVRDGQQAVSLALQAVSHHRTPAYLDTLAAAYAETGKFDKAVEIQREALSLAPAASEALVAELQTHLAAFEAGEPWRE